MSNANKNTPPVIRVFLSSTFADMDNERRYFNEVLAPKISRACAERGVSFFSVDLRWGITEEDQIDGKVLPICLNEIDKCRPYFIGILGNRYGSVMETVPNQISQSIPWLLGKEGRSITELEMLYAVLDHKDDIARNSAFYIRSDTLSERLYGSVSQDDNKLSYLKQQIRESESIPHYEYDSIEEFGELVLKDLLDWLDTTFPEADEVNKVRREWYSSELLRDYIDNDVLNSFLNSYISESDRSLLIHGDGARGKTTFLTAWQPEQGHKILINCASDDAFLYWPSIAKEIVNQLREIDEGCGYPDMKTGVSTVFQLMHSITNKDTDATKKNSSADFFFVTDEELEKFRIAFLKWLNQINLKEKVTIIINDLNLLEDENSHFLSWLPTYGRENLNIICSTNNDEMVQNSKILGWNCKEMPLFEEQNAKELVNSCLHAYGKNLSPAQFDTLMGSIITVYPGLLHFVMSFLINHGRFNNLDKLIKEISSLKEITDIYQYIYNFLLEEYTEHEQQIIRTVLGILRCTDISLSEHDCFTLSQAANETTVIEWSHVYRVFEQLGIISGDYWNIRNEEFKKFADKLLSKEEMQAFQTLLGDFMLLKLKEDKSNVSRLRAIKENTAYSKSALIHYQKGENWDKLLEALFDSEVLFYLSKLDWCIVRVSWMHIFLYTDFDIRNLLINLLKKCKSDYKNEPVIATRIAELFFDLEQFGCIEQVYEIMGTRRVSGSRANNLISLLSKDFIQVYNAISDMKKQGNFRGVLKYISEIASQNKYSSAELCNIYFFKTDAEEHLGLFDEALKTANAYYTLALGAGYIFEMRRALSMRGTILFRLAKYNEAIQIQSQALKFFLADGNLREYLAAKNTIAMCEYHLSNFEESIRILDELFFYWTKLSNTLQAGSVLMNKSNALFFSGDSQKAFDILEDFYKKISDTPSLIRLSASILVNLGSIALELKQTETAENYLLLAAKQAKETGLESSLIKVFFSLCKLYESSGNFMKAVDFYKEKMELLWKRREYPDIITALDKATALLFQNKYNSLAKKLLSYWKEKFSSIEGGQRYFEEHVKLHTTDSMAIDKLKEQMALAKSEGNMLKVADVYTELAKAIASAEPNTAIEYLLDAARLYKKYGSNDRYIFCIKHSLSLVFKGGCPIDEGLYQKILDENDNDTIKEIATLWEKLGNKNRNEAYDIVKRLVSVKDNHKELIQRCIIDTAPLIIRSCTAEEMINTVKSMPEKLRKDIIISFDKEMRNGFEADHSELTKDYMSPAASEKLSFYEKCISFLKEFNMNNAAAMAGNIALIFRRRNDKEKTIYYHTVSLEQYKALGNNHDSLIELMNLSTAYMNFNETEKAIEFLRKGLIESEATNEANLCAAIAGNLASLLTKLGKVECNDEIMHCFGIEEAFFRRSGSYRDLAISLLNQVIYLHRSAPIEEWKGKLDEVSKIVRTYNLNEFVSTLSKLEWFASQKSSPATHMDKEKIEERINTLLSASDKFSLQRIDFQDSNYHAICLPKDGISMGKEELHLFIDPASPLRIIVCGAFLPKLKQKNAIEEINKYIVWWNSLKEYTLAVNESSLVVQSQCALEAQNLNELCERLNNFIKLWDTDKMNVVSLCIGLTDLSVCQGVKLKALHKDN